MEQPREQKEQVVSVHSVSRGTLFWSESRSPSAPVGQTLTHWPQEIHPVVLRGCSSAGLSALLSSTGAGLALSAGMLFSPW